MIEANYYIFIIFIAGLMCGSFISVLSSRDLSEWQSILWGKSRCPKCHHELTWKELIPLFSFFYQKGKCRECKENISIKYPLLEIVTAIVFVSLFMRFGLSALFFSYALFMIFLIALVVTDIEEMVIPDHLLIGTFLTALPITYFDPNLTSRLYGFLIYLIVIGLLVVPSRGKWMGYADLIVAPILGWVLGYPNAIAGLYLSFVIGAIVGISIVLSQKKSFKSQVPFGPFLVLGFFLAIWFGQDLVAWYMCTFFSLT